MLTIRSKNNVPIRLSKERWNHIITSHTDMENNYKLIDDTIQRPHMILKGIADELRAVRFFEKTHLGAKYLVVAYKEINMRDGFVITAYKATKIGKIIKRGIVWKKQ